MCVVKFHPFRWVFCENSPETGEIHWKITFFLRKSWKNMKRHEKITCFLVYSPKRVRGIWWVTWVTPKFWLKFPKKISFFNIFPWFFLIFLDFSWFFLIFLDFSWFFLIFLEILRKTHENALVFFHCYKYEYVMEFR